MQPRASLNGGTEADKIANIDRERIGAMRLLWWYEDWTGGLR